MSGINEGLILEFIKAYYNALTYDPNSIFKFYAEDSYICRPNLESKIGKKFEEMKGKLAPDFPSGSQISITKYFSNIEENTANLIVKGTIINGQNKQEFTQNFTLQMRDEPIWIIADSFIIHSIDIEEQNKDLEDFKRIM